jgi:trigger factor
MEDEEMGLVSTNKIETNKYEFTVSVDAEGFENAVQKAYMKARNNISIQGFRKGKAPRKMIEKLYGEAAFYEDAVNQLIPDVVGPAVEETGYTLVAQPEINVESINKDNGVVFKVKATVKPEVEISDYKGIEVEKIVKTVTDEDIDKEIEKLRQKNGRIITVDDRSAQLGDTVNIDFEGFKDGVAFDGGKEDGFDLKLGSSQFIPGFEKQIIGKNTGDEFAINVVFPENYQMEELAGQPAEFKIKINEIKTTELPEVDDEFVKDTTEFDTIDELKADIKKRLEENAVNNAEMDAENKLFETVIEKMNAEIPEVMYESKIDELVRDFSFRLSQQGLDINMYLSYMGMDMSEFRNGFKKRAENQVKLRLALEKIAELENISVSDEKVDEEINKMAKVYNVDAEKIKSYVSLKNVREDLMVAEASKLIKESAKFIG